MLDRDWPVPNHRISADGFGMTHPRPDQSRARVECDGWHIWADVFNGSGDVAVSPMKLIMGRRRLMGSPAGSRKDLRDILYLAATHDLHPRVTPMPLHDAKKALEQMHKRSVHVGVSCS